jgi:hypothetical protein
VNKQIYVKTCEPYLERAGFCILDAFTTDVAVVETAQERCQKLSGWKRFKKTSGAGPEGGTALTRRIEISGRLLDADHCAVAGRVQVQPHLVIAHILVNGFV